MRSAPSSPTRRSSYGGGGGTYYRHGSGPNPGLGMVARYAGNYQRRGGTHSNGNFYDSFYDSRGGNRSLPTSPTRTRPQGYIHRRKRVKGPTRALHVTFSTGNSHLHRERYFASPEELRQAFERFGKVLSVRVGSGSFGFVNYDSIAAAAAARQVLNGSIWKWGVIHISWANPQLSPRELHNVQIPQLLSTKTAPTTFGRREEPAPALAEGILEKGVPREKPVRTQSLGSLSASTVLWADMTDSDDEHEEDYSQKDTPLSQGLDKMSLESGRDDGKVDQNNSDLEIAADKAALESEQQVPRVEELGNSRSADAPSRPALKILDSSGKHIVLRVQTQSADTDSEQGHFDKAGRRQNERSRAADDSRQGEVARNLPLGDASMREKSSSVAVVKEDTMAAAKTPAVSKVQSEQDSNVRDEVKSVKIPKEEDKEEVKEEEEEEEEHTEEEEDKEEVKEEEEEEALEKTEEEGEREEKRAATEATGALSARENERQSHETVVPRTTVASISTKQRNPQRQRRPKLLLWLPNVAAMKGSEKLTFDTVRTAK